METYVKGYGQIEVNFEITSLDYPCEFCNSNSYRNFHFILNDELAFNICSRCLLEERDKKIEALYDSKKRRGGQ